jgi:hypothetical protein
MLSEISSRPVSGTTTIWEDNHSCIANSQNALVSEKTKHIDLKYHFVKDYVHWGLSNYGTYPLVTWSPT